MRSVRVGGIVSGFLYVSGLLIGQAPKNQGEMHARVMELYNFSPHTLTPEQRTKKSAEMDAFWSEMKQSPASSLPLLRAELANAKAPPFFMEDGSELLETLSKDKADLQLAANSMARCDLADVRSDAYFFRVHKLSMGGIDTTKAALHILDHPGFGVPLPQHAMRLDESMTLVYLLVPVREELWMDEARKRFAKETNEEAERSLLTVFFYVQTKEGDAALEDAAHDATKSKEIRDDALHHQQDVKDVLKSKMPVRETEPVLRQARHDRLGAVSDESIDDVQSMTAKLMIVRHQSH